MFCSINLLLQIKHHCHKPFDLQCDVNFGMWHGWGNTAPRCTSKTDGKGFLLLHVRYLRLALRRKRRHLVVQNPIILHDNARSHTTAAVKDLLGHWQREILEHLLYWPDMSPCDYDLFAKVKEPLRGTRYNTGHAIGRSFRNISNDGRADGVRPLRNTCKSW